MSPQNTAIAKLEKEKVSVGAILAALYFMCMPLSIVPLPGGFSMLKYVSILVGGFLIGNLFLGTRKMQFNIVHFLLAIYVVYSISSLFFLRDERAVVTLRGTFETSIIFFLVTSRVYNEKEKNLIVYSWLVVGIITTIVMLFATVSLEGTGNRATLGIGGGTEDPNQLCGYFILPVLLCVEKINKKDKLLFFYIALAVTMIYAVFRTGSRGGLIAVLSSVLIYILFASKVSFGSKVKIIIGILLLAVVFVFVVIPLLPADVTERFSVESVAEDKGSGRFDIWAILLGVIFENVNSMFFGHGLESTSLFLANANINNTVAHNHWIQLWCDQGLIGMIIFFSIFVAGIVRVYKQNAAVAISIFGMLFLSMSLTMYAYYKPFWNIIMMAAIDFQTNKVGDNIES